MKSASLTVFAFLLCASLLNALPSFSSFFDSRKAESYEGWNLMEDFDILHHFIRMRHQVPELRINVTYVLAARQRAIDYAESDGLPSPLALPADENLHYAPNPDVPVTANDVMTVWYRLGEEQYNYEKPEINDANIKFARIVSKSTQEYGCGQARIHERVAGVYTVCLYSPKYVPGNEESNILPHLYGFEPEQDSNGEARNLLD